MTPRSIAIPKSWKTLDIPSLFSAFIYPALGLILLTVVIILGLALSGLTLHWSYGLWGLLACGLAILACNVGIGPLHRIIQHRAGEMKWPAQLITVIHVIFAMQGTIRDWVNYHAQHHRFSDKPGDPHNPHESKRWAWVGWLLWRDKNDLRRPMPLWLRDSAIIRFFDRHYNMASLVVHLFIPAAIYLIVWAAGGSLVLTAIIHAAVILGRAVQFHATTLGINVLGHLKTPKWADHAMALLTGGEAFHDHHHDEPASALHRPKRGLWNRIVDYNGTMLLIWEKLGWVKNLRVAPQFA